MWPSQFLLIGLVVLSSVYLPGQQRMVAADRSVRVGNHGELELFLPASSITPRAYDMAKKECQRLRGEIPYAVLEVNIRRLVGNYSRSFLINNGDRFSVFVSGCPNANGRDCLLEFQSGTIHGNAPTLKQLQPGQSGYIVCQKQLAGMEYPTSRNCLNSLWSLVLPPLPITTTFSYHVAERVCSSMGLNTIPVLRSTFWCAQRLLADWSCGLREKYGGAGLTLHGNDRLYLQYVSPDWQTQNPSVGSRIIMCARWQAPLASWDWTESCNSRYIAKPLPGPLRPVPYVHAEALCKLYGSSRGGPLLITEDMTKECGDPLLQKVLRNAGEDVYNAWNGCVWIQGRHNLPQRAFLPGGRLVAQGEQNMKCLAFCLHATV